MKILLVYPKVEDTFWSFKHALKIVRRKAAFPPLGALTIAAMLPASWEKRLVDMNVKELRDADILWADLVLISAMVAQKDSARQVIERCRQENPHLQEISPNHYIACWVDVNTGKPR